MTETPRHNSARDAVKKKFSLSGMSALLAEGYAYIQSTETTTEDTFNRDGVFMEAAQFLQIRTSDAVEYISRMLRKRLCGTGSHVDYHDYVQVVRYNAYKKAQNTRNLTFSSVQCILLFSS